MTEIVSGIGRRSLLRGALVVAGGALATAAATACGSDNSAKNGTSTPRRGGQLRLVAAGDATPSLNPLTSSDTASFFALFQIYDQLVRSEGDKIVDSLAESVEPSPDGKTWTIRVRQGAAFHNGKPVTAADVAYSIRALGDPVKSPNYNRLYADVDFAGLAIRDQRTLTIPLHRPRGDFRDSVLSQMSLVYPEGTGDADWAKGIGSGPFTLTSSGAEGTVLAANRDYWDGAPLLDGATLSLVADPMARLNAVRSGQADYAVAVSPTGARSVAHSGDVEIRKSGPGNSIARSFEMNLRADPFTNASVRTALKLLVDRKQLVDNVLQGQGSIGNDVYGLDLPGYATNLPQRERDVDKAKSLLAAAGVKDLTIKAADLVPGTVDAANLLAEQARDAGLHITVEQASPATYFNDFGALLSTPFQAFYFVNRPASNHIATYTGSSAPLNLTGVSGADYDSRLTDAQGTVDAQARQVKFDDLQRYLWDNGGDVVWGFADQLDAVKPGVGGVFLSQSAPMLAKAYLPA